MSNCMNNPMGGQRVSCFYSNMPRRVMPPIRGHKGGPHTGAILQSFAERRLFVDARDGLRTAYEFHALFRAFLRERAVRDFGQERTRALMRVAAEGLARSAQDEDAFALFLEAGAAARAADLFVRMAPEYIRQGRWRTLQEWHTRIPIESGENAA